MKYIVQYSNETFEEAVNAYGSECSEFLDTKEQAEKMAEKDGEKNYKIYRIEEV